MSLPLTVATTSPEGERWHPETATRSDDPRRIGTAVRRNMRYSGISCNLITPAGPMRTLVLKDKSINRNSDMKLIT
jgi:hypothetical protein